MIKNIWVLIGLVLALATSTACKGADMPKDTLKPKVSAEQPNSAPTSKPGQSETEPAPKKGNNVGTVKKNGSFWVLAYKTQHLCLPAGLYQHEGLALSFDPSTIQQPPPNVKLRCLSFDTNTLAFVTVPNGRNTLTLNATKGANGFGLSTTRRVAVGPSATGTKTVNVCVPDGFEVKEARVYTMSGYSMEKPDSACERWVFTSIKAAP